jgi:hypothetical protein
LLGVRVSESDDPERETGSISGGFGVGLIIGKVILLVVPQPVSLLNGRVAAVRKLVDRTPTQNPAHPGVPCAQLPSSAGERLTE